MAKPFFSVLIDTYNHERFIEEAIVSVLGQDFPATEREIIVVDDGSTDRTPEIVCKFEPQVRLLRKTNGGQASAFNAGIPECKGEIVAFLDGDDWWAPGKLSRVAEVLKSDSEVGIVGHGIISVLLDGSEQAETLREGFRFQANSPEGARLFQRRGAFLGTSRMTIRAGLLKEIGAVPREIEIQADEYLFTLAAVLARVQILPEQLTYYRLHEDNSFQLAKYDARKLRRKETSLTALANRLSKRLRELGISEEVACTVLEYTQASANQLRLMLDGGWPWNTVKTEWRLYRILHPEARISHRVFKWLTLSAALITTPQGYYGAKGALARNRLYLKARQRWLPVPTMPHIQKDGRARS
jgi:glycosyltransferase involved in cell wall biosynthesis